ncbi:YihY/virulence factor BrkB family protein [Acidisoma cladoniae]|jgi:membrane protein|uniref:YihY/virulence factor BrkB family protein n=1 Tax=Acidisoma cladoniae TaxID=3040935 RepID=UPI00254E7363|nr:YihY/virulence factor BrkB family protein [Acidisoma sp. PAMC 29798]
MPIVNDALRREIEGQMKKPGGRVMRATALAMISDYMSLNAAGCAFYATLALFPAVTMLISIYGMVFDPVTVEPQLAYLRQIMPLAAYQLLSDRVHDLVSNGSGSLSISLVISFAIAFWSAASGTKSLIWALNFAYRRKETRSILHFQLLALVMTLGAVLAAVLGIGVLVGLPNAFTALGLSAYTGQLAHLCGIAGLFVFVLAILILFYKIGPAPHPDGTGPVFPGALTATVLWLLVSVLFSFYVSHVASYSVTYGALGAAVGVMMWFYVSAYAVLFGAELNAQIDKVRRPERRRARRAAMIKAGHRHFVEEPDEIRPMDRGSVGRDGDHA